jgi:hypothetical protein
MQRYVWVEMEIPLAQPALTVLRERLGSFDPKIIPFGGVNRRIRLTVDAANALEAGQKALDLLATTLADWTTMGAAFVDEVVRVVPVDPSWENLARD